ncbi:PhzF family phenazine biosynthesis protein [Jiulongibacter sp. NS-SX5]|uniref:PhzF family phenazine biosynthesis protein n=1 Tax=Jiulongibacter sp. NS-SX5 TaxID=3463854 RepID=UPI004058EB28
MKLKIYQADAFTSKVFGGNPAAIIPLEDWLSDELMQNIALENNLSETAYVVKKADRYEIRWFTPTIEVNLCGHATLAAAHILFEELNESGNIIHFDSKSGPLSVSRDSRGLTLDFPTEKPQAGSLPEGLADCFNVSATETLIAGEDFFLVYQSEEEVKSLNPDFNKLAHIKCRGVICTAPGNEVDFVSRFFAPAAGINEDPVTGSAHVKLCPYWSERLGKQELTAWQTSARKGELICQDKGERTLISGSAVTYLKGEIWV